jgi:hypothetical protein
LLKLGDAELILAGLRIVFEHRVQAFEDRGLPVAEKLRLEVVLAPQLRLTGGARQESRTILALKSAGKDR